MPKKRMPIRNARPDDKVFTRPWGTFSSLGDFAQKARAAGYKRSSETQASIDRLRAKLKLTKVEEDGDAS